LLTPLLGPSEAFGGTAAMAAAVPGWSDSERRRTFLAIKKMFDVAQGGVRDREVRCATVCVRVCACFRGMPRRAGTGAVCAWLRTTTYADTHI
jgi:hypothetical protein